jgi:hypothetical protein
LIVGHPAFRTVSVHYKFPTPGYFAIAVQTKGTILVDSRGLAFHMYRLRLVYHK